MTVDEMVHKKSPAELMRRFTVGALIAGAVILLMVTAVASTAGFFLGRDDANLNDKAERRAICGQRLNSVRNDVIHANSELLQAQSDLKIAEAEVQTLLTNGLVDGLLAGASDEELLRQAQIIREAAQEVGEKIEALQEKVRLLEEADEALEAEDDRYAAALRAINDGDDVECG